MSSLSARAGLLFIAVATSVSACGERTTESDYLVTDSAGLAIVVSRNLDAAPRRTVRDTVLSIGLAEGDPTVLFDRIRSALRNAAGQIVVADGGSHDVRIFTADGQFVRSFGGQGGGPGEFQYLESVHLSPDGSFLVAYDPRSLRLSGFSMEGALLWTETVPSDLNHHVVLGLTAPDALQFQPRTSLTPEGPEGVHRPLGWYLRYRLGSNAIDTLTSSPGYEFVVAVSERTSNWLAYEIPFARNSFAAVQGSSLVVGSNDDFSLRVINQNGAVERIIRAPEAVGELTQAEIVDLEARVIGRIDPTPARRASLERLFREPSPPAMRPAFGEILTESDGSLWISEWRSGFDNPGPGTVLWHVFAPDGRHESSVQLPGSLAVTQVEGDEVIGISTDDLGVERILVLRLVSDGA